jgi:hypothetical protein
MDKSSAPAPAGHRKSKRFFFFWVAVFIVSSGACLFVLKLDRQIEKTVGKVIDSYSKRVFASRKKSYDEEYVIVRYSVGVKEYTGKSLRRKTGDFVPVFFYRPFPGMAWFYTKTNANLTYCCIVMALSLLGVVITRPRVKKSKQSFDARMQRQKK